MSDQKPSIDVRPYAVHDALSPDALPRVVVQTVPSAAIAHVVSSRFTATSLNAMELLALTARGVRVEDPRGVLPVAPEQPAQQPLQLPAPDALLASVAKFDSAVRGEGERVSGEVGAIQARAEGFREDLDFLRRDSEGPSHA